MVSDAGVMLVSKEDVVASDIDPERHAYWDNPEVGLVGYPVIVEAVHQLHCLVSSPLRAHNCSPSTLRSLTSALHQNLLRRYSYFNSNFTSELEAELLSRTTPKYQKSLRR